ncbi:L-aspartate oxidase [Clostridium tetanomorphum]|uniref:L-aspartate oxidase n=1 Tax=Clostridium tetanomorphum TaxID=1553 RepID=A0A923E4U1_CLOTT|nr:L-aspartate oxidase [Clostridium tetanomorphum]KAJ52796.1 L-aspartate oxidase [Clostridium tetanomorphum DSM 665]MBC2396452.1 L-aspartate oxidase [Clostridium tetanomorphum]MBP1865381.1 L-aspartate oxidase [Clostridium tetanomorphum]NRS84852.1 L-aspartate oxidase [Clostridium tetanomorphum]NRZ98070.1 L-aspartate oxidase [Clostridium tetanomorphum]
MNITADVLIVGTGIAGIYSALNLNKNLNIVMITKSKVEECNSYLAQGGISTAKNKDDINLFIKDTLKAGNNKNNIKAVEFLASKSISNIKELIRLGVEFDTLNGKLDYTREGAHSINRIVHCADETGKRVFKSLLNHLINKKNIKIYENTCLVDLIKEDNTCYGGIAIQQNNILNIQAKYTILATGGIGGLFKNSTNQRTLTGNGIGIALKNNIELKDLNYIQFHPTGLYEDNSEKKKFLISESLRGEGAKLVNINGERFVNELLPRDVVSKAILKEQKKTNSSYVYLYITHMPKDFVIKRFPTIYSECKKRNIDITKEKIPVTPVQHYFMGGIKVDHFSRTSIKNLFACGETSCTGVHGTNRLASNSLLEALVFSKEAANFINNNINNTFVNYINREISYEEGIKLSHLNERLALNKFIKVRGDIKNELVTC